ncbi:MAG: hypothetical protein ACE5H1_01235 [Thermodesulfobacteriota bacterium]
MKEKLREILIPIVRKIYDKNLELNGIHGHYVIHPEYQDDKAFADYVLKEVECNAQFRTMAHYVKLVMELIKKHKKLEDWQKWAKEFVSGFDDRGYVKLQKTKKQGG